MLRKILCLLSLLLPLSVFSDDSCENYYPRGSEKPFVICDYDFGKEKEKVFISKECVLKKCEAYKAYEKALSIDNPRTDTDQNWGTVNCKDLDGVPTYLSNNRQVSGELLFCQFKDYSFIAVFFLNTSRINWKK